MYSGCADYEAIGRVKAAVKIPVIGNGDVVGPEDALRLRRTSGCDGIMIGRAGLGNPWVYQNLHDATTGSGLPPYVPAVTERRDTLLHHLDLEVELLGERKAAMNLRRIVVWYTAGLPHNKNLRGAVCRTTDVLEIRLLIQEYFDALPSDIPAPCAPVLLSE
jgi:tRNA-dihydrouridine synthase